MFGGIEHQWPSKFQKALVLDVVVAACAREVKSLNLLSLACAVLHSRRARIVKSGFACVGVVLQLPALSKMFSAMAECHNSECGGTRCMNGDGLLTLIDYVSVVLGIELVLHHLQVAADVVTTRVQ